MEETIDGLLRRAPNDGVALVADGKEYTEEVFYTTCHKTANLLNHLGVREGGRVAVSPAPVPENVFGFFGACLVGAETRFVRNGEVDADVLICDDAGLNDYDVPASCRVLVHGDGTAPTGATEFDREIWGENPVFPSELSPDGDPVVVSDGPVSSELVREGRGFVEDNDVWNGDEVSVGPLDEYVVETVGALAARATLVL